MSVYREDRELSDLGSAKNEQSQVNVRSQRDVADNEQLARLGKKSVLKRNFSFMTILGFSCAVLVTWEGTLMSFAPGLTNGGPAGLIYGFIVVWIGNLSVFSTLCELVSMAPTSGGQYHWVAMLAPRWCSKFLSYITGWWTLAGWQGTSVSAAYLTATMLQGLVKFLAPEYDNTQSYQGTLLLWLCVLIAVLVNTVVNSMLPKIEGIILVCHVLGFFGVLITLITFGSHETPASAVFATFRNGGHWPTQTLSCFVGLLGFVFAFAGVDCSFHMCEETKNPSIAVPRSIMFSIACNGVLGLAMVIAMLFVVTDIDKAVESPTKYPYIEIFFQATNSRTGTAVMASLIIFMTLSCIVGVMAATSRIFWAFARDRGLPGWRALSKVNSRTSVPVLAVGMTSVISCLLGLINIGSATAYNALVSLSISGLYSSYLMAAGLLLYRRCGRGFKMPDPSALPALANTEGDGGDVTIAWGPWHVPGIYGIINNAFACVFMLVVWFFSFWPININPTPSEMNFSVLMTGSTTIFSIIYYVVWARKEYRGPVVEV